MALYGIRHPSKLICWSRRALGACALYDCLKRLLLPNSPLFSFVPPLAAPSFC
ncbi:YqjK-like family protein [Serratia symbiotica]|nr:YqjK-like family protein [Serratia symbiotica]